MSDSGLITGLDLGSSHARAVIGMRQNKKNPEILGLSEVPIKGIRNGVIFNIEEVVEGVEKILSDIELQSGKKIQNLYVSMTGNEVEGINAKGLVLVSGKEGEVTLKDKKDVLDMAEKIPIPLEKNILHRIPQKYLLDDKENTEDPLNTFGVKLEGRVHLITGYASTADSVVKCVNRSGHKVSEVVFGAYAASRAFLGETLRKEGVLFIDIGKGTTDVLFYDEGSPCYTEVFRASGYHVSHDISVLLKTGMETAEKLKHDWGCCLPEMIQKPNDVLIPGRTRQEKPVQVDRRVLCGIIQSRLEEIFNEIKAKLITRGYLSRVKSVILSGGESLIPGISELAESIFSLPSYRNDVRNIKNLERRYESPRYDVVLGLLFWRSEEINIKKRNGQKGFSRPREWGEKITAWLKEFL